MKKAGRVVLGALLGLALAIGLFGSGVAFGGLSPQVQQAASRLLGPLLPPVMGATASAPIASAQTDRETLFAPFWQAWDISHSRFVDQPVDDVALLRGAIRGMLDALGDEHTAYMDPDQYRQASIGLSGEYEGIGAFVDTDGEFLTIVSPMPGSPAEKAGVKAGDVVVAVDGDDVTGIDPSLVVQRILGPKGTTVRLTLRRENETDLIEVSVVRDSINIPSVEGHLLDSGLGYIQLNTFGEDTTRDLKRVVADLVRQDARGLILDLRGNGGGYLATAVEVSSEFLSDGVVLTERFGDGREEVYRARAGGQATTIPLVVLVDGGSASASEIVAGALQDYGRAKLVGETTYGKGSVQDWIPLDGDQGAVRVTIARWYTPKDRQINEQGLAPDVEVAITDEDLKAGRDPQLDKAVEVLLDQLGS
ncbi:MAG: S41 family peptidase [Anaerolineales bacterium]|nr:S41 family peptidase [Anaerolineales bacterium]